MALGKYVNKWLQYKLLLNPVTIFTIRQRRYDSIILKHTLETSKVVKNIFSCRSLVMQITFRGRPARRLPTDTIIMTACYMLTTSQDLFACFIFNFLYASYINAALLDWIDGEF